VNSQGLGPSGLSGSGTSSSASGTTYSAVSAGTITVRGDAGTGHDSMAGLSRDTANANGSVQNGFDAQTVQDDMAIQQMTGQVGMQVVGDIANALNEKARAKETAALLAQANAEKNGDEAGVAQAKADLSAAQLQEALWDENGAARIAAHAAVSGLGAAMGGGNLAGAVTGTVAGDIAGNAASHALDDSMEKQLLSNVAAGVAGAVAGGAVGGSAGAISGAGGALNADLYNRKLHPQERDLIAKAASAIAASLVASNGGTEADQQTLTDYWTNMLTLAAGAQVDAQAAQQLGQYEAQLQQSGNTQAYQAFMTNLGVAQDEIQKMSGYAIVGTSGPIVADGSVVKTFQSSSSQYNDSSLFGTPGGTALGLVQGQTPASAGIDPQYYMAPNGPTSQQVAAFAHDLIQRAATQNGAVTPVYPLENVAFGWAAGKIVSGVLDAVFGTEVAGGAQALPGVSKTATNSAPDAPVYNTQGATRAAANSGNWSDGSLSQTVKNIAGSNPQVTYTTSGKTIYTNPTTGASVVYDNAGNYYRVQNPAGQYLDKNGNPIPNNVPLIGPNKTTQTGVPSGVRNGLTHFNNTDPGK
jgi:filamentous hemagglutinin